MAHHNNIDRVLGNDFCRGLNGPKSNKYLILGGYAALITLRLLFHAAQCPSVIAPYRAARLCLILPDDLQ